MSYDYDDAHLDLLPRLGDRPRPWTLAELAELGRLEAELGSAWLAYEQARGERSLDAWLAAAERAALAAEAYATAVLRLTTWRG